ncbi:MAG: ParA family protein [Pseudomonadota bacterium]
MSKRGKIIAVSSTKGGPGKTTLVGCIADTLSFMGYRVALLDVDPNQNLTNWVGKRKKEREGGTGAGEAFYNITLESQQEDEMIVKDCRRLADSHDFVLIDVAGVKSQSIYVSAGASSLVIIPATPSEDDIKEAMKTKKIVESAADMIAARLGKEIEITTRIVLNATQTNTVVQKHVAQELERKKFPVFLTTIGFRTVFRQARFMGQTPIRVEPNGAGSQEIKALVEEIIALIGVEVPLLQKAG